MSDARTGDYGNGDRLPWLEAVEEEEREEGPSRSKMIAWIIISLLAIAVIVGGLLWARNQSQPGGGNGELIAAPQGDYKIKPGDPGGMAVEGEGDTAFAASEGEEPKGQLDTAAVPESPVTVEPSRPRTPVKAEAPRQVPTEQAQSVPVAPAPAQPQGPVGTIQLGAFSSQAAATRAWTALSGRFRYLAPLSHSVVPVQSEDRTLYRLRASGAGAAGVCRRLRVAGEDCSIVG
ncbi:MAG TPA: SPOR domain-containing protein [Allosphingosinicella sp.]|nr:SPOR domain-containing protein [Allosphingosinicella sp.]